MLGGYGLNATAIPAFSRSSRLTVQVVPTGFHAGYSAPSQPGAGRNRISCRRAFPGAGRSEGFGRE